MERSESSPFARKAHFSGNNTICQHFYTLKLKIIKEKMVKAKKNITNKNKNLPYPAPAAEGPVQYLYFPGFE